MFYISTRGGNERKTSADVIKQGLASDGGLFVPETIPELSIQEIKSLCNMNYIDRAVFILSKYLTDYSYDELFDAASKAYSNEKFGDCPAPVKSLDNLKIIELWHGPTCAFKDMALQIMPRLLSCALKKTNEKKTTLILVATSGDTGKAALEGYKDIDGIKIMVFYPRDGVSDIQKLQMDSQEGSNVNICSIDGNFDDAQTGVKKIFLDKEIEQELAQNNYMLSSANSINWGRLAPQIVYYISAYCDLINNKTISLGDKVDICVPTGNFGNIFAAYLARQMGLPVRKLICASNTNNILTDFIKTGIYDRNRNFYTTMSPSMDILISSNLERLLYMLQGSKKTAECMKSLKETGKFSVSNDILIKIQDIFYAGYANEENTQKTIKETFNNYKYLIDTHTAVAIYTAKLLTDNKVPVLVASTASPYKFSSDVLSSIKGNINNSENYFDVIRQLSIETDTVIPEPIKKLENKARRFNNSTGKSTNEMWSKVKEFIKK